MPNELVICRCEEVTADDILAAIESGTTTVNDVKRQTRAGMGVCQGIYCVCEIAKMISLKTGQSAESIPVLTARPPVRMVSIDLIARLND
jgi:NAD(P)H-nitrite reductase large subunit